MVRFDSRLGLVVYFPSNNKTSCSGTCDNSVLLASSSLHTAEHLVADMATTVMEDRANFLQASVADTLKLVPVPPWSRDPLFRKLYAVLIPACLFVAATN